MADDVQVIVPNLKRRLSGVTATIVRLVPLQAAALNIKATGPGLPNHLPHISLLQVLLLPRRVRRVWHARRNTEMLLGLLLKRLLRKNLRLVFTSASQRQHSGYTRWLIDQMDAVIATSGKGQSYLNVPSKVVMHGIDVNTFKPAEDRAFLRRQLNLPEGVIIGCFGRIRHQKGTDVFVDALLEYLPDRPNSSAIILGRATASHQQFATDLRQKIASRGLSDRLIFLPEVPVDQIARWYRALDLFVAPQRWEGFGLTPLEAMACGVPVIATNVGAFEELIVKGETGNIVPLGDVTAMRSAIVAALDSPENLTKWAMQSRDHVVQNFKIEQEAETLLGIYKHLLG